MIEAAARYISIGIESFAGGLGYSIIPIVLMLVAYRQNLKILLSRSARYASTYFFLCAGVLASSLSQNASLIALHSGLVVATGAVGWLWMSRSITTPIVEISKYKHTASSMALAATLAPVIAIIIFIDKTESHRINNNLSPKESKIEEPELNWQEIYMSEHNKVPPFQTESGQSFLRRLAETTEPWELFTSVDPLTGLNDYVANATGRFIGNDTQLRKCMVRGSDISDVGMNRAIRLVNLSDQEPVITVPVADIAGRSIKIKVGDWVSEKIKVVDFGSSVEIRKGSAIAGGGDKTISLSHEVFHQVEDAFSTGQEISVQTSNESGVRCTVQFPSNYPEEPMLFLSHDVKYEY